MKSITANQLANLVASGENIDLIDVRSPIEYHAMHVTIARNEPLSKLDPNAVRSVSNLSSTGPLYVVCHSGGRSKQACEKLAAAGMTNVINVEGGTMACVSAGVPVVRGKSAIPLNCQVQILTGSLIVIGTALAVWEHPYWAALPAVMGVGLMYSGLTDTCAMGSCLARMPWNQSSCGTTQGSNAKSTCCNK